MKNISLVVLLTIALLFLGCGDEDDSSDNDDQENQVIDPLAPGQVPYVISGQLPVPTYRNQDGTVLLNLDGSWLFKEDPETVGDAQGWHTEDADRSGWRNITVPGVWNAEFPDLLDYNGLGWYALEFEYDGQPENTMLRFGAVFLQSLVYLNGELIGYHRGGYTPFHILTGEHLRQGENVLVVRVDNRIGDDTIPVDTLIQKGKHGWWLYGGISRSVTLHHLPDPWLFKIEPRIENDLGEGVVTLGIFAKSAQEEMPVDWEIQTPANETLSGSAKLSIPGEGYHFYSLPFETGTPSVWSRETPANLYEYRISNEESGDSATVRFGYRTTGTSGNQLLLNGQRDFWWGISRHSDYPDTGSVETSETIAREVGLIKELHINHIRPAHYPVAPQLLDALCDAGVTVLEEIPMYQLFGDQMKDPTLITECLLQLGEMIERDKNNPAIVSWSVGNEFINVLPGAKTMIPILTRQARLLDPSRPVTAVIANASCVVPIDFGLPTVDIIGLNQYYGWYLGSVDDAGPCLDTIQNMYPDKVLVASEFGAGTVYGNHLEGTPGEEPLNDHSYSEEWQVWFLEQQISQMLQRNFMSGVMPWVLADFRMQWDPTTGNPHPVSGMNLKGLLTHDRTGRKLSFDLIAETYANGQAAME